MSKSKIFNFFVFSAFFLLISNFLLFAEDITITTYYPSPMGVYDKLKTNNLAVGSATAVPGGDGDVEIGGDVDIGGDLTVSGKITAIGGIDPPYVSFEMEARESIIERVQREIPEEKLNQAILFWNEETDQFEIYLPIKGQFRNLQGNILE